MLNLLLFSFMDSAFGFWFGVSKAPPNHRILYTVHTNQELSNKGQEVKAGQPPVLTSPWVNNKKKMYFKIIIDSQKLPKTCKKRSQVSFSQFPPVIISCITIPENWHWCPPQDSFRFRWFYMNVFTCRPCVHLVPCSSVTCVGFCNQHRHNQDTDCSITTRLPSCYPFVATLTSSLSPDTSSLQSRCSIFKWLKKDLSFVICENWCNSNFGVHK